MDPTHPELLEASELLDVAVRAARSGGEVLRRMFGSDDLQVEEKARNDFVTGADRESERVIVDILLQAFPSHSILAEESGVHAGGDDAEAGDDDVEVGGDDIEWMVDPLDGTSNFMRGVPYFCTSVACRRGVDTLAGVVLDPLRGDLFTAFAGGGARLNGRPMRVRRSAGLEGAFLATGFPFKAHPALESYLDVFREVFLEAQAIRRCGAAALDLAYTAAGIFDGFFEFRLAPWDLAAGCLLVEEAGGVASDLDGGSDYLSGGNVLAGAPDLHRDLLAIVSRHTCEERMDELVPR